MWRDSLVSPRPPYLNGPTMGPFLKVGNGRPSLCAPTSSARRPPNGRQTVKRKRHPEADGPQLAAGGRMSDKKQRPPNGHPWRAWNPGWLQHGADAQRAERVIPAHARLK